MKKTKTNVDKFDRYIQFFERKIFKAIEYKNVKGLNFF